VETDSSEKKENEDNNEGYSHNFLLPLSRRSVRFRSLFCRRSTAVHSFLVFSGFGKSQNDIGHSVLLESSKLIGSQLFIRRSSQIENVDIVKTSWVIILVCSRNGRGEKVNAPWIQRGNPGSIFCAFALRQDYWVLVFAAGFCWVDQLGGYCRGFFYSRSTFTGLFEPVGSFLCCRDSLAHPDRHWFAF
jgi:hypothetical protein